MDKYDIHGFETGEKIEGMGDLERSDCKEINKKEGEDKVEVGVDEEKEKMGVKDEEKEKGKKEEEDSNSGDSNLFELVKTESPQKELNDKKSPF